VRAVIRFPNAKPAHGNKLLGRAGIWPARHRAAAAWATEPALEMSATAREEPASAIALAARA